MSVGAKAAGRCRCGACDHCAENARWERIFEQKFADPDYYAPRILRRDSTLTRI
jgi:hypothetical protein